MTEDEQLVAWREMADAGDETAMSRLAVYFNRHGDLPTAVYWYKKSADAGSNVSMAYLGWVYKMRGDREQAIAWSRRAVDAGNLHARQMLDGLLGAGDNSTTAAQVVRITAKNMAQALASMGLAEQAEEQWAIAADSGDVESMMMLANLARIREELGHAILQFERAASAGNLDAMAQLGALAETRGSLAEALVWYQKALDCGGGPRVMVFIGAAHKALGSPDDAMVWYLKAAETGNTDAMFNLGNLFRDRGDDAQALGWYERAGVGATQTAGCPLGATT